MTYSRKNTLIGSVAVFSLLLGQPKPAQAQTITPSNDNTDTVVTQTGQVFTIGAGTQTDSNLFHSFNKFQLTDGTMANFLADPTVENIFTRVTGNNETLINGTLRITGAPANLYLLNPNGIIFGPNATLNLAGDLTALTANHISFDNGIFKSAGFNDYNALVGPPNAYVFDQAGTIRNNGDLELPSGRLTVLGGEVINNGSFNANGLQISEVADGEIIQVSQTGSLLNLEFSSDAIQNESGSLTSTHIPGLLTNGGDHADQIISNEDGQFLIADLPRSGDYGESAEGSGETFSDDRSVDHYPTEELSEEADRDYASEESSGKASSDYASEESSEKIAEDSGEDASEEGSEEGQDRPPQHVHRAALGVSNASEALEEIEALRNQEFTDYFGRDLRARDLSLPEIQDLLTQVSSETGDQSVIVYVKTPKLTTDLFEQTSSALELLIFTASGEPINLTIPEVSQADLFETVADFRQALVASSRIGSKRYMPTAQKLYQWLIKPIEDELGPEAIDNILFSMDSGLRTVPIAALHDGEQFLIEKYSVGMVPSLGLMNPTYKPLGKAQVLAMGASEFEELQPLPAVPAEIETISKLWPSRKFLNEKFTQQNLISQQQQTPAQIIHLATHAEFSSGNADESYIQLWDKQLQLSDIHTLGWDSPAVDLLVLSACRTALGDANAEMGFAGIAVASGVKSALASLWTVSDVGTLALMSEFYHQLGEAPTKSGALRTAQLAMLRGNTHLEEKQLPIAETQLPEDLQGNLENLDLSHPYFWAGFTLIGNPW
ncbi:MAG: CHAT domain-containing protein [Cyanobacteria bacterium P01_D01_bin.156]